VKHKATSNAFEKTTTLEDGKDASGAIKYKTERSYHCTVQNISGYTGSNEVDVQFLTFRGPFPSN
jgi:hypothetical protein